MRNTDSHTVCNAESTLISTVLNAESSKLIQYISEFHICWLLSLVQQRIQEVQFWCCIRVLLMWSFDWEDTFTYNTMMMMMMMLLMF